MRRTWALSKWQSSAVNYGLIATSCTQCEQGAVLTFSGLKSRMLIGDVVSVDFGDGSAKTYESIDEAFAAVANRARFCDPAAETCGDCEWYWQDAGCCGFNPPVVVPCGQTWQSARPAVRALDRACSDFCPRGEESKCGE